jgi:hypothetical protein
VEKRIQPKPAASSSAIASTSQSRRFLDLFMGD